MTKRYWDGTGTHQTLANRLRELIPAEGPVDHNKPRLERLRRMMNAYHDLYNNGGYNRPQACAHYFGAGVVRLIRTRGYFPQHIAEKTEPPMDAAIVAAAQEQGWL